jgi:hypothetical protein
MPVWTAKDFKNLVLLTPFGLNDAFKPQCGVCMRCSGTGSRSVQALNFSLDMIANLIYLSRHTETHCAQQHDYLDQAANIMTQLAHHPRLEV